MLEATDNWLLNIDNGVLFLELRKAFDTVDQKILIELIKLYEITGIALKWFISYLKNKF